MAHREFPHKLEFQPFPDIKIQVLQIPDLLRFLLNTPPVPGQYQTRPPRIFDRSDFARDFLSDDELSRLNAFKAMKKQVEWMSGRFAAKHLARQSLKQPFSALPFRDIHIRYQEHGAPFLEQCPNLCLSLSHSGIYTAAAVATTPGTVMGIDLEAVGDLPDKHFMNTAFTRAEIRAMETAPADVFRHWTLKEAYLKYIRMGFNESLHHVEIIQNTVVYKGVAQNLACWSRDLDQGYILSMVSDPPAGSHS
ncbi:MAG: 4'-phosphopantetheinyl transferase superfamily protein [Desulfobacter sp.]